MLKNLLETKLTMRLTWTQIQKGRLPTYTYQTVLLKVSIAQQKKYMLSMST